MAAALPEQEIITDPNVFWGSRKIPLCFDRCLYQGQGGHPYGYEAELLNVFEHFVEPGDLVVDAGASIGYHTCFLSKLVGDSGIVIAFEPQLISFKLLAEHVHLSNKLPNVMCLREALWSEPADLRLWSVKDIGYSSVHKYFDPVGFETVSARPLDDILTEEGEHPKLIKIDCEGSEYEILSGAQRILQAGVDCVVLELNYMLLEKIGKTDEKIRQFMHSLGYEMFLINFVTGPSGIFTDPIRVNVNQKIEVRNGWHINVMFSTQEKVNARWKIKCT